MPSAREEWDAAKARLKAALVAAGIKEEWDRLGSQLTSRSQQVEREAQERRLVFGIPDMKRRTDVIRACRDCQKWCQANEEDELRELQARVDDDGERIRRSHLWGALGVSVMAVLGGYWIGGLIGAIVGAVVGLLIGYDRVRRGDRAARADLVQAREAIHEQRKFLVELGGVDDSGYTASEERTGLPDAAT
jgi:hypothetical protein